MKNVVRSAISKEVVKIIPLRIFKKCTLPKREGKGREGEYLLLEFKEYIE